MKLLPDKDGLLVLSSKIKIRKRVFAVLKTDFEQLKYFSTQTSKWRLGKDECLTARCSARLVYPSYACFVIVWLKAMEKISLIRHINI